jgi:tRNA-specific adenosine deaminase 1
MEDFANSVAKLCIEKYNLLKTGKPNIHEWTVLSGIILKNADDSLCLVALATGTKCLGETELINATPEERGSRLSDSHAEVLARRAFIRYLYDQIDMILSGSRSVVFSRNSKNKIELNSNISFHFFSSQTPCGDCSIFPKQEMYDNNNVPPSKIRRIDEDISGYIIAESCHKDVHITGAKCVEGEKIQNSQSLSVGPLRTKPGRGDPTCSLSCSDKIAK